MRLWLALSALMATQGPVLADPFAQAMAALGVGDTGTGAALFDALAKGGDGDAMYNLALLYHQGVGLPQNGDMALYWAWRARLAAVPKAMALVGLLMPDAPRERRQMLHERLMAEAKALQTQGTAEAATNFVRLALIEEGLAAKPDLVQIYVWYSLAAALGHPGTAALRDVAFAGLSPTQAKGAQAHAMADFATWCVTQSANAPEACAVMTADIARLPVENG